MSTPAKAIATVWRKLNLLCNPSTGVAMLQTRSQLASIRKVMFVIISGVNPCFPRNRRAHSIGAWVK